MKNIFNKLNGILLGGFLGGVLIAGLGSGIALAQYMEFEFDDSLLPSNDTTISEFTYEMEPDEILIMPTASVLTFDEKTPAGTVITQVEHNPQTIEVMQNVYASNPGKATVVETYPHYIANDFEAFMKNKDVVLEGLKAGKIVSIESDYHFTETAICNPADKGRVFRSVEDAANAMGRAANADEDIVGWR